MVVEEPKLVKNTNTEPGVYFCPSDNCTKQLYTLINSAHASIHCALYDLDLPEIIELLVDKSNQIDVKIITDTDNYENIQRLNAAGSEKYSPGVGEPGVVPSGVASEDMRSMADNRQGGLDFEQEIVKQDERSALMHNKF